MIFFKGSQCSIFSKIEKKSFLNDHSQTVEYDFFGHFRDISREGFFNVRAAHHIFRILLNSREVHFLFFEIFFDDFLSVCLEKLVAADFKAFDKILLFEDLYFLKFTSESNKLQRIHVIVPKTCRQV